MSKDSDGGVASSDGPWIMHDSNSNLNILQSRRRRDSGQGYSSGIASDGSITDSPSSKSPARRRRRLGSEVSSSGYESMRDGTTSHVSGSDSADEKGVLVDKSHLGNTVIYHRAFRNQNIPQ